MIAIGWACRVALYVGMRRYRMVMMLFLHHELERYQGT